MRILSALLLLVAIQPAILAADPAPIKVLIIDGQNNHNWQQTTPILKKILEDTKHFTVEVATSPPRLSLPVKPKNADDADEKKYKETVAELEKAHKAAFEKFRPELAKYDVIVSNYNGEPWGKELNADFDKLLGEGKIGFVVVHAANNAFGGWKEYNQMIGMGWRGNSGGDRLYLDAEGKEVKVPSGKGDGSGHRYVGPFTITIRDSEHPITKGMPKEWLHVRDELYDNMRGPIENVKVLATAYSDKEKKGTGAHEPMIWTVSYGKGRVFHTPMGHDANAMRCWGFAGTLTRGTEWAATGKVTIALPEAFPNAEKTSPIPEK
ncbi:MAG: ThuA domain-containing protein [Planctomycetes bacterium]|nr:ThuA domain-containing protein [Planctomycetota bacterium]